VYIACINVKEVFSRKVHDNITFLVYSPFHNISLFHFVVDVVSM